MLGISLLNIGMSIAWLTQMVTMLLGLMHLISYLSNSFNYDPITSKRCISLSLSILIIPLKNVILSSYPHKPPLALHPCPFILLMHLSFILFIVISIFRYIDSKSSDLHVYNPCIKCFKKEQMFDAWANRCLIHGLMHMQTS